MVNPELRIGTEVSSNRHFRLQLYSDATVRSGSLRISLALFVKDQTKRYPVTKHMGLHEAEGITRSTLLYGFLTPGFSGMPLAPFDPRGKQCYFYY